MKFGARYFSLLFVCRQGDGGVDSPACITGHMNRVWSVSAGSTSGGGGALFPRMVYSYRGSASGGVGGLHPWEGLHQGQLERPPRYVILWNTINKWVVCILLECILVILENVSHVLE